MMLLDYQLLGTIGNIVGLFPSQNIQSLISNDTLITAPCIYHVVFINNWIGCYCKLYQMVRLKYISYSNSPILWCVLKMCDFCDCFVCCFMWCKLLQYPEYFSFNLKIIQFSRNVCLLNPCFIEKICFWDEIN